MYKTRHFKLFFLSILSLVFFCFTNAQSTTTASSSLASSSVLISKKVWQRSSSCNAPILYKMSKIDEGFNLSKDDLIKHLEDAAGVWNDKSEKQLFKYDENARLKIKFTFDKRQKDTKERNTIKNEIDDNKKIIDTINIEIVNAKKEYEEKISKFEKVKIEYETQLDKYNAEVKIINDSGGGSADKIKEFENKKSGLEETFKIVNTLKDELNKNQDELNAKINKNNNLVKEVNQSVGNYNKFPKKAFEEGRYDSNKREITIFQYSSEIDLKRVLAHELGHARGFNHIKNSVSIMHYLNSGDKLELSKEDEKELDRVCKPVLKK